MRKVALVDVPLVRAVGMAGTAFDYHKLLFEHLARRTSELDTSCDCVVWRAATSVSTTTTEAQVLRTNAQAAGNLQLHRPSRAVTFLAVVTKLLRGRERDRDRDRDRDIAIAQPV